MTSKVTKRSISISGHKTSISLEDEFFDALWRMAAERKLTLRALVENIEEIRGRNLSSSIRVYLLEQAQQQQRNAA